MTLQDVQNMGAMQGYRIEEEDRSWVDSTPIYVIYKGFNRVTRLATIGAVARWLTS